MFLKQSKESMREKALQMNKLKDAKDMEKKWKS